MNWNINWETKSILVVEDDYINFSYLDVLLRPTRAKVLHAEWGERAIDLCREHPDIDVVLMDIRLPGITGLEATQSIRAFREKLPIIAQTAYASDEDRKAAIHAGCLDFIEKPIRANDMLNMIKKYIES